MATTAAERAQHTPGRPSGADRKQQIIDATRELVAKYGKRKQQSLLANEGIVRNRLKIEAAIQNAKAFLVVQEEFRTFDRYIWSFVGGRPKQNAWKSINTVPARTPESDAMSKDLKRRDFKFVGSTICYAFMQAVGMVNDHLVDCFRHAELQKP